MRRLLKKLIESGEFEQIPDTYKSTTAYRIPDNKKVMPDLQPTVLARNRMNVPPSI